MKVCYQPSAVFPSQLDLKVVKEGPRDLGNEEWKNIQVSVFKFIDNSRIQKREQSFFLSHPDFSATARQAGIPPSCA
jgi:hypothetical protein